MLAYSVITVGLYWFCWVSFLTLNGFTIWLSGMRWGENWCNTYKISFSRSCQWRGFQVIIKQINPMYNWLHRHKLVVYRTYWWYLHSHPFTFLSICFHINKWRVCKKKLFDRRVDFDKPLTNEQRCDRLAQLKHSIPAVPCMTSEATLVQNEFTWWCFICVRDCSFTMLLNILLLLREGDADELLLLAWLWISAPELDCCTEELGSAMM